MKAAIMLCLLLTGCSSQVATTTECDSVFGTNWGQGYGVEVESSSNLDSNRCVQLVNVWCCAI